MSDAECMGTKEQAERDLVAAWHAYVHARQAAGSAAEHRMLDAAYGLGWHLARAERAPSAPQLRKVIMPAALFCPYCGARHLDETRGGERWDRRAHTTHRCQANGCGRDFDVYVSGAPKAGGA